MEKLSHKEMTAHIRNRIKVAGIKARVCMQTACGDKIIRIDAIRYKLAFTHEEQRTIRQIAVSNDLTYVMGLEIDIERMTDPYDFSLRYNV